MNFFRMTINDEVWTIYIVDDNDTVIADEDEAATTQFYDKEIYFRYSHIELPMIRHELWHVYWGYTTTQDADLTEVQMEEVSAAMFSLRGEIITRKANEMYEKLQELKKTMEPVDESEDQETE